MRTFGFVASLLWGAAQAAPMLYDIAPPRCKVWLLRHAARLLDRAAGGLEQLGLTAAAGSASLDEIADQIEARS